MKNKHYIVYNRAGEYHHSYNANLDGALNWAIDCAKTVRGSVKEVVEDKETVVFDCSPKANVHTN
jgi:hypothetical protein|tara:strand:- start:1169 stop:1363 length:195 start_codon:yes stop_codon:yes gene_type:complete